MGQVVAEVVLRWTTEFFPAHHAHILVRPHLPEPPATQHAVGRAFEVGTPVHEPVMLFGFVVLKLFVGVDWLRAHDQDGPAFVTGLRTWYERHDRRIDRRGRGPLWRSEAKHAHRQESVDADTR
jgi:hypothetical protein